MNNSMVVRPAQVHAWGAKVFAASAGPASIRRRAAAPAQHMILDADLIALARLVHRRVDFAVPAAAGQLSDVALQSVTVPRLAQLAEHSAIMDPHRAAVRARTLLPDATIEVVRGTGDGLPFDHAVLVTTRTRTFLEDVDSTRRLTRPRNLSASGRSSPHAWG
jgi:hypothetical protein